MKISPSAGVAGDEVQVTVGCGFCFPPCSESPRAANATCMPARRAVRPEKYSFPILLSPLKDRRPLIKLGRAMPAFGRGDIERTGALPRYRLRFAIPAVKPGQYQLEIRSGAWGRGILVTDAPRWRLRVREPDPASAQGGGSGMSAWMAGAAIGGVLLAAGLVYWRWPTARRGVRARSTSR